MTDDNKNLLSDKADRVIALVLTVAVSVLVLAIEGKWASAETTEWFSRAVAVIAVLSSVFGWGVVARPWKGQP